MNSQKSEVRSQKSEEANDRPLINFPTEAQEEAMRVKFLTSLKLIHAERRIAVEQARPALARLVQACGHKTGQGYKLRALLFSVWNGKRADLSDTLALDWGLKKDFCAVLLGFGYESGDTNFFYDAMGEEFQRAGLLEWFIAEDKE